MKAIDPVRDMLDTELDGWEPPQVMVIGGQSSGKSALLERITMMPVSTEPYHAKEAKLRDCEASR